MYLRSISIFIFVLLKLQGVHAQYMDTNGGLFYDIQIDSSEITEYKTEPIATKTVGISDISGLKKEAVEILWFTPSGRDPFFLFEIKDPKTRVQLMRLITDGMSDDQNYYHKNYSEVIDNKFVFKMKSVVRAVDSSGPLTLRLYKKRDINGFTIVSYWYKKNPLVSYQKVSQEIADPRPGQEFGQILSPAPVVTRTLILEENHKIDKGQMTVLNHQIAKSKFISVQLESLDKSVEVRSAYIQTLSHGIIELKNLQGTLGGNSRKIEILEELNITDSGTLVLEATAGLDGLFGGRPRIKLTVVIQ